MTSTPYLDDILDQPAALERVLRHLPAETGLQSIRSSLEKQAYARILITGMGSSYFAAIPLYYRLLRAGFHVLLIETAELIQNLPELVTPQNLILTISQSGQSAEIIELLHLAEGKAALLAVTNDAGSPLARASQENLLLHAGEEHTVSCKTYVNTLAVLTAVGDALAGDRPRLPELAAAPGAVSTYLANFREYADKLEMILEDITSLFLLGRGDSMAAAQTGGLIIKKASRFPAQERNAAAYRHGPIEVTTPQVLVLVFGGSDILLPLNTQLISDIHRFGGSAMMVTANTDHGPLNLPPVPEAARPILEILPAQLLSLALSRRSGLEAGAFRFATKVTTIL